MSFSFGQDQGQSSWPKAFWYLLVVAVVLRLVLVCVSLRVHTPASHPAECSDMRQFMSAGEYFANGMSPPGQLLPQRDRLLPLALGGVFAFTGRSIPAAQLTCIAFSMSGIFALFALARMLVAEQWALLACALWVFDPQFIGQSCLPLSENLATPLYILALWCLVRGRAEQSTGWLILSAAVLAVGIWARACTILLAAAVLVWLLAWPVSLHRRAFLITIVIAFVGASWLAASAMSYKLFGFFAPNSHTAILWDHSANKLLVQTGQARDQNDARDQRREQVSRRFGPEASLPDRMAASRATAIQLVREHPWLQLRNHAQAFVATAFMPDRWSMTSLLGISSSGGVWHGRGGFVEKIRLVIDRWGGPTIAYAAIHFVFTMALWWFALRSVPEWFAGKDRAVLWLLVLALGAILSAGVINVEGIPRYRLPGMPMLVLLAVRGLARTRDLRAGPLHLAGTHSWT